MENISRKLLLISKLYEFNNNYLNKYEKIVNKVNNNVIKTYNNSVKILRISFEVNKGLM